MDSPVKAVIECKSPKPRVIKCSYNTDLQCIQFEYSILQLGAPHFEPINLSVKPAVSFFLCSLIIPKKPSSDEVDF